MTGAVPAHILDEAIAWQERLGDGSGAGSRQPTPEDLLAFEGWRTSHPDRDTVWRQLTGMNQRLATLRDPFARQAMTKAMAARRPRANAIGSSLLGLALALGVALWSVDQYLPVRYVMADYLTPTGDIRQVTLPDGSRMVLNTRSAVDLSFDADERVVKLRDGDVWIETTHGDPRPFVVQTSDGRLRALGTRFVVSRRDQGTQLVVLQSAVAARPHERSDEETVPQGQQVWMNSSGLFDRAAAEPGAGEWAHGYLVVENARLADVAQTLSRYRAGRLAVAPAIADRRVTGTFPLADTNAALDVMARSLSVHVDRTTPLWVELKP